MTGLDTKLVYVKRWRTLVNLPAQYADEILEALRDPAQAVGMRTALEGAQKIIERDYPNGQLATDIRAVLAAQPPAAPVGRGCCSKCRNISECEAGCKLACTCGGDPGQPASEHDISCPAGLSPSSAGTAKLRSGLAAELMAFHDLCTQNSAGGDGEYRVECSSGSAEQARALRAVLREAAAALQNDLPQTLSNYSQDGQTCPTCGRVGNGEG